MKRINKIWETYGNCWSDNNTEQRTCRLSEIISDDFEYQDPNVELKGLRELSDYMEQFQNEFKGASFAITDFNIHHDRSMANWNMLNKKNEIVGNGTDFAQYKNGKLQQITSFFAEN